MVDKFQTEPNALEPGLEEDAEIPAIEVPQAAPPSEAAQPEPENAQPELENAQPEGNIQVPGTVLEDEPEAPTPGWTQEDEHTSVEAFKQIMDYRKTRDELGSIAESISKVVSFERFKTRMRGESDDKFDSGMTVIPEDQGTDPVQYRRDYFPTEEERHKGYLEAVGLGQINRGTGQQYETLGRALVQSGNLSAGLALQEYGQFLQAHSPDKTAEGATELDIFKEGVSWKNVKQALNLWFEEAQIFIGQNIITMAASGVGLIMGGPPGARIGMGVVNVGQGVGEARGVALQHYNEWENYAEKAEDEGRQVEARAFRQIAAQFDPDRKENLPIIVASAAAIALLENIEDQAVWFKPIPEHLKQAVRKRLYFSVVRHIAQGSLQAGATGASTETIQAVVSAFQEIKMRGAKEWIEFFDWNEKQRKGILNSAAAGGMGASFFSGGSMAVAAVGAARKGSGATPDQPEQGSDAPMFDAVPPTAPEEAAPIVLDDAARAKLGAYLSDPAAVLSNKDRVAEALGIPKEQVGDYLDAAAEEGLLTKIQREGVPTKYVRKQRVEGTDQPIGPILPESDELAGRQPILPEAPNEEAASPEATIEVEPVPSQAAPATPTVAVDGQAKAPDSTFAIEAEDPAKLEVGLQTSIEADQQRLAEIRDEIKAAPRGQTIETRSRYTQEVKETQARIKAAKLRLEQLEEQAPPAPATTLAAPSETPAVAPPTQQEKAPKGPRRGTPEGGQSLVNYLTKTGGIVVPKSQSDMGQAGTRPAKTRAREFFYGKGRGGKELKQFPALFTADGKGRSIDDPALWDDLVAAGYLPPYYNPEGENYYDPRERLIEMIQQELGGDKVLSSKFEGQPLDLDKEAYQIRNAAESIVEAEGGTLTEAELDRIVYLVQDENFAIGDAIERVFMESRDADEAATETEQSPISERPEGQGDQPGREGGLGQEVEGDARAGQARDEGGNWVREDGQLVLRPDKDFIPFAVYRGERGNAARSIGQRIEQALREAFGVTEETKTERLFNKAAPLTKDGKALKLKWFREPADLPPSERAFVERAARNDNGRLPFAYYNPNTSTIVLALFAGAEGVPTRSLLSHELIHALVAFDVISTEYLDTMGAESVRLGYWTTALERSYRRLYAKYDPAIRERYIKEEKAALLVQIHMAKRIAVEKGNLLTDILDRIVEFLTDLRRAFKGQKLTHLDVIDSLVGASIARGEMGRYVTSKKAMVAAAAATEAFENKGSVRQALAALDKTTDEIKAEPAPVVAPRRPILSIPGLKKPLTHLEAYAKLRAEREQQAKITGPFAPRPDLAEWLGIPLVEFQADVQHIYDKRAAKDHQFKKWMKPITSIEEVRSTIETVLDNAQFAYKYKKDDNWNIVYRTDEYDHVVSISPKVTGRPGFNQQLTIPTAFIVTKGNKDEAILTSLKEGEGIENVRWKRDVASINSLLHIVRQGRGTGEHPSVRQLINKLNEEQLALKGVEPEILAAIARTGSGQDIKGINTIIRELVDDLGITLNQGYGGPWGYKSRAGVIRQKAYYDLDTLSRNLGALMEARFNWVVPLQTLHQAELSPLDTINLDAGQGFREWVSLYISAPHEAYRAAPGFFDAFEAELELQAPNYLSAIGTAQMALEAYFAADPTASMESMITNAPNQTSIAKISREIERDGVFSTLKHGVLLAYKDVVASEAPLASIVRQMLKLDVEKRGFKRMLSVVQNAAKLYRLIPQAQQAASFDVERGIADYKTGQVTTPGLPEILRDALQGDVTSAMNLEPGGMYSQFLGYLVSLRAAQLWQDYRDKKIPRPPTVVPEQTVLKAIQDYESRNPQFRAAQEKLNRFTKALLKLKRDAGLITQKQYDILNKDKFYVPFQRSFDEEIKTVFKEGGGVNIESILKRILGSRRDVIDPLAMLTKDVYTTRQLIAVNDVWKALIKLAEEIGPAAGRYIERVNPKKAMPDVVAVEEVMRNAAKEAGLSVTDTQDLMNTVTAELGSDALATVFKQITANTKGKPIALFLEDGKLQAASVNDPVLAKLIFDSFQFLGKEHTGIFLNALSLPTKAVRFTITTNPSFIIANAIRDAVFVPFYEFRALPFWTQARGLEKIMRGDPILEEAMRAGMIMGGVGASMMDQTRLDKSIKQLIARGYKVNQYGSIKDFVDDMRQRGAVATADGMKGGLSRFQTFMEFSETATRIQLYEIGKKRALRNGLSEVEAQREGALYANDYCDYSRHGSKIGPFRKMVEFFGAILQGLDRFRKTVAGSHDLESVWRGYYKYKTGKGPAMTQDELRQLHQSTFAIVYSTFLIGGISVLLWSIYGDDERVRDVPAEIRRTHWIIPLGDIIHLVRKVHPGIADWMDEKGGERDLLRIPKPFDAAFLSNLIERYLWEGTKGDPNWKAKFLEDFTDTSLPPMFPTWMNIYSISQGIDPHSGKSIENLHMQKNLAPPDRYTPFTSDFAKWWGEKTNSSPVQVDAMLKGLGTSWARDILNLNIIGSPWYNPNKPAKGLDEAFMMRRFFWQVGKMSESGRNFREIMGEENPLNTIMRKSMTALNVYHPSNKLGFAAGSYSHRLENAPLDHANKFLMDASPRERGYAILMKGLEGKNAKFEKLDPMNRASDIGMTAFQIQKELQSGTMKINRGLKKETTQDLNANSRLAARDVLIELQWMEQHNALTLTGEVGYENREIYDAQPLYEELKAVDPAIYSEFMSRLGRKNVLPFKGIQATWPELKKRLESDELLKEAQEGKPKAVERYVKDLWFRAKYPATKEDAVAQ